MALHQSANVLSDALFVVRCLFLLYLSSGIQMFRFQLISY